VDLSDRRDGQWFALEGGEQVRQRLPKLVFDRCHDLLDRRGRDVLAQPAQLGDVLRWQQVVARREDLTELDGSRPKLFERQPQVPRLADRLVSAPEPEAPEDRNLI